MTDTSMTRTVWPALINGGLVVAVWLLTLSDPAMTWVVGEEWGAWVQAWAAYGWITGVSAAASAHPWRRMQTLSSIALAVSIPVAIQVAHVMLPPSVPVDVLVVARRVVTQGIAAWWLPLIAGLSLLALSRALGIPHVLHRVSAIAGWMLLVSLAMRAGVWIWAQTPDVPWFAWLLGLVLLPLQRHHAYFAVTLLWLVCASALITLATQRLFTLPTLQADLVLCGLALGLPTWLAWAWRMDFIQSMQKLADLGQDMQTSEEDLEAADPDDEAEAPVFFSPSTLDLYEHLDSPAAQEGADKYTRE